MIEVHDPSSSLVTILLSNESVPRFKALIARALNTFADAHPELKEFGDILEHGKPLQDYYSQRSDPKKGRGTEGRFGSP